MGTPPGPEVTGIHEPITLNPSRQIVKTMKKCIALALTIILLTCILAAGCTKTAAAPPVQMPATMETAVPAPSVLTPVPIKSCSLTPGPTQQPPAYESVSITVDRNTISQNPTITTSFNGGQGLGMVESMTVTVTRSDCEQEQQVKKNPGIGTSVTMMGTTTTDRVTVVVVMTSGEQYTVIDQDYPFPGKI
jgi:hypothetical protein